MKKKRLIQNHAQHQVSIDDRGLNYGDGFFTTAKVVNSRIVFWQHHVNRLITCQQKLSFPPLNFYHIEKEVQQLINGVELGVIKILVTRGTGGRGYAVPEPAKPNYIIKLTPYPDNYNQLKQTGVELDVVDFRLGHQPYFAGLKTLNRLEQVMIKDELAKRNLNDGIVLDITQNVIETSMANIIWFRDGKWYTPKLDKCGIQGVFLTALKEHLKICSVDANLDTVLDSDAVFCCNSLLGICAVTKIGRNEFCIERAHHLSSQYAFSEVEHD